MPTSRAARFEAQIAAPRSVVWRVLTDLTRYAAWNPFVLAGRGRLCPDAEVRVTTRLGAARVDSVQRVVEWEDERTFAWQDASAVAPVARSVYTRRLHDLPDGGTLLAQQVVFRGPLANASFALLGPALQRGIESESRALKREAEQLAAGPSARAGVAWSNWAGTVACHVLREVTGIDRHPKIERHV